MEAGQPHEGTYSLIPNQLEEEMVPNRKLFASTPHVQNTNRKLGDLYNLMEQKGDIGLVEVITDDTTETKRTLKIENELLPFPLKVVVIVPIAIGFLLYRLLYHQFDGVCLIDHVHDLTWPINRKLVDDAEKAFIGIGQVMMDLWVIYILIHWFFRVKNMRLAGAAGTFFLFRTLMLSVEKFPFPYSLKWESPGFFSLVVPYDHTRDFFYSGHTGIMTIMFLEQKTQKNKVTIILSFICLLYMMFMLITTRVHYSIDIVGALIYAPFFFKFSQLIVFYQDWAFSVPFMLGKMLYLKCKERKIQGNDQVATQSESNK